MKKACEMVVLVLCGALVLSGMLYAQDRAERTPEGETRLVIKRGIRPDPGESLDRPEAGRRSGERDVRRDPERLRESPEARRERALRSEPGRFRAEREREIARPLPSPERVEAQIREIVGWQAEQMGRAIREILAAHRERMQAEFRELRAHSERLERELQELRAENERLRRQLRGGGEPSPERERQARERRDPERERDRGDAQERERQRDPDRRREPAPARQ